MSHIFRKIKSHNGSTLIIALMFMLICVFVGGSVLVAATVNSGRLVGKRQEQQDILSQRSIVTIIANQLKNESGIVDLKFQIVEGAADSRSLLNPGLHDNVKALVYNCVNNAFVNNERADMTFQVTLPGDIKSDPIDCYIYSTKALEVYIGFVGEDDAEGEVKLHLSFGELGGYVSCRKAKIEKGWA